MAKKSAGILLYRRVESGIELFLVHPGGPYWAKKDEGAWSLPKGLYEKGEHALDAARREFAEETGFSLDGAFVELGQFKQPSGKIISAWAFECDCDFSAIRSNLFSTEWPPKSGHLQEFPEVDRAGWFKLEEASRKILAGQRPIIERLLSLKGFELANAKGSDGTKRQGNMGHRGTIRPARCPNETVLRHQPFPANG